MTIEAQLALGTDQGVQAALKVYSQGAFSKPYAEVTLSTGLGVDVAKGVTVMGMNADGKQIRGLTMTATKTGDTVLLLQYHASPVQASFTDCHVGGNPEPNTRGCEFRICSWCLILWHSSFADAYLSISYMVNNNHQRLCSQWKHRDWRARRICLHLQPLTKQL